MQPGADSPGEAELARDDRAVPQGKERAALDRSQLRILQECDQVVRLVRLSRGSRMDYIQFGQTDLKVSQLCLGTMSMGSSAWKSWVLDETDSVPILRRALEVGIGFCDVGDWCYTGRK